MRTLASTRGLRSIAAEVGVSQETVRAALRVRECEAIGWA